MLRRTLCLCAALFAALAATAQAQSPPPGSLVQPAPPQACFSNDSGAGCSAYGKGIFAHNLGALAISPDGHSLYASGSNGGGIELARAANGDLTPVQSFLDLSAGIAVAPDGRNVYVGQRLGSSDTGGIFTGTRGDQPGLQLTACIDDTAPPNLDICSHATGLADVQGVAVSPDGKNVYAAAAKAGGGGAGALTTLTRGPDGKLTLLDCRPRTAAASGPCSGTGLAGLSGVDSVIVSPDGQTLYTASGADKAVIGFSRATSGANLGKPGAPINCVAKVDINEGAFCKRIDGLVDPVGLAMTPDGTDIYVADSLEGIVELRRNTVSGVLTNNGCIGDDFVCAPDAIAEKGFRSVAISSDGRFVYAVGGDANDGWLRVYARDAATGKLAPIDCITHLGDGGCRSAAGIKNLRNVVASPDGQNVYTASDLGGSGTGAVSVFTVVQPPTPDPAPVVPAPQAPADPPAVPSLPPMRPAVDVAPTSKIAAPAGKVVKAKSRKTGPGRFVRASGTGKWSLKLKKKLAKGKYIVFSRAIDSAGHVESKFGTANRRTITVK